MSVTQKTVSEDEAGIRLDRWFRRHYPHVTQGMVQKFCRTGQIRADGKRADASTRLEPGQTLRIPPLPRPTQEKRAPRQLDERLVREIRKMVIYSDDQVIVLNKPSGLATQGGQGITRHIDMMLDGLKDNEEQPRPRLVHRIDKDTSGLLLLARTPGVAARLTAAFRGRDVRKTYWAVVVGRPDPLSGEIDQPLARLGAGPGSITVTADRNDEDAQSARTEYEVTDSAGRRLSWLTLSPLTGRTHQLRVHCEALGTPILGDPKYGAEKSHVEGFTDQLHLHARSLRFPHPAGGWLEVSAELPPHMKDTFRMLGFTAGSTPAPRRK